MPNERAGLTHFILATAGHVDHGKTALVRTLTGTDTDRLPEEKARGITIDLGFAHLSLPGFSIGVIDVPGHEDFVRNMIAGVGSIDLALLVVAADDGWMPQTEEHLQILEYLGVKRAVVALTKADLGKTEMRTQEIREQLRDTPFAAAPIIATSIRDQTGLNFLRTALRDEFAQLSPPREFAKSRLFVDCVFSIPGSGTVVTGTLTGGRLARGETVFIRPQDKRARIRGLQSHNQALEIAGPQRRVALNLPELATDDLVRGSAVCGGENQGQVSRLLDVVLERTRRLPTETRTLGNGMILNLHFGGTRYPARVQLRDCPELLPNEKAIARLRLPGPIHAFIGDRFILRDASERTTVAGGTVLDPVPGRNKLRSLAQRALVDARAAAPDDLLVLLRTQLEREKFCPLPMLLGNAPFSRSEITAALEELGGHGLVFVDEKFAIAGEWWRELQLSAAKLIQAEHEAHPEKRGLEITQLRNALALPEEELLAALLRELKRTGFVQTQTVLHRENFRPSLPSSLQEAGDEIRAALAARPLDPPARREVAADSLSLQAFRFLCESGELILLNDEIALRTADFVTLRSLIERHLQEKKSATVSELRQATGTTRRVLVPLLEKLDQLGHTKREGDRRRLR